MKENLTLLIGKAIEVSRKAYAPYSNYRVGAVLLGKNGEVFTGCNVENASYPAGICAERTALVKAISEGVQEFEALIVATQNGGSPCGICRQMLAEFAPDMRVITTAFDGTIISDTTLRDLLPASFGSEHLIPEDK